MKLLNIDANAKTIKGQAQGFMTAVLYLAPAESSGYQTCPMAALAGCAAACLNTAGRGGIAAGGAVRADNGLPDNAIQAARVARTRFFFEDRQAFLAQLVKEIGAFVRKAGRKGLVPVVRLNGTSDLLWEKITFALIPGIAPRTVFDYFPAVQFYDYTKIAARFGRPRPANYHLSLSYSAANPHYMATCLKAVEQHGANLITVVRTEARKAEYLGQPGAVDGDEHDLRFLDAPGSRVFLKAKGRARKDTTGFVVD